MRFIKLFYTLLFVLLSATAFSQEVEMADKLREEGKIYVVVVVVAIVFIGIIGYLIAQDKRIKKLEKQQEEN